MNIMKTVNNEIARTLEDNLQLKNKGKMAEYQYNCNYLKGINFVVNLLTKRV